MVDVVTETVTENSSVLSTGNDLIDATQNVIMNAAENVSMALGTAGKATAAEVSEIPFYGEVEFWVGMAFILSACVLFRPLGKFIKQALQNRIKRVIDNIEEAAKLRDDAQKLLAEYQRRFINSEKEAERIVENSRKSIQNLKLKELEKLKVSLNNKEKEANRRIAAANTKATDEINAFAGKASVDLARKAINQYLQNTDKSRLIDEAIAELDRLIKAK